eukprot:1181822-Prorocentrum_minimum.AAC.5
MLAEGVRSQPLAERGVGRGSKRGRWGHQTRAKSGSEGAQGGVAHPSSSLTEEGSARIWAIGSDTEINCPEVSKSSSPASPT